MQPKKNPKVSLENKKGMFFQIGLAVTLLAILIAFEWKSYDKTNYNLGDLNLDDMEEEIIPITRQEVKPPPPPPPPPEIIEIVEDEVEIENEVEIGNFYLRFPFGLPFQLRHALQSYINYPVGDLW